MGRATGISWTRSTRNFWSGCTKVGPGCDGCYAEAFNRFTRGKSEATGQAINWGPGAPRVPHLEGAAKDLRKWNAISLHERETGRVTKKDFDRGWTRPGFWPVFLNSHSDLFDNEVPREWRDYAFAVIRDCPALDFLLVTKRIGNVEKMVPESWLGVGFPLNVRLIITVVDQAEADRDVPKLLALRCRNGISYEPALGPINWVGDSHGPDWLEGWCVEPVCCGRRDRRTGECCGSPDPQQVQTARLEWIIVGGESDQAGHATRPFDLAWARSTIEQCHAAGVAVFVKQLGSDPTALYEGVQKDRAGADPAEWPEDLRVQEFPAS